MAFYFFLAHNLYAKLLTRSLAFFFFFEKTAIGDLTPCILYPGTKPENSTGSGGFRIIL